MKNFLPRILKNVFQRVKIYHQRLRNFNDISLTIIERESTFQHFMKQAVTRSYASVTLHISVLSETATEIRPNGGTVWLLIIRYDIL